MCLNVRVLAEGGPGRAGDLGVLAGLGVGREGWKRRGESTICRLAWETRDSAASTGRRREVRIFERVSE